MLEIVGIFLGVFVVVVLLTASALVSYWGYLAVRYLPTLFAPDPIKQDRYR